MSVLGNIIWLVFGGFVAGIEYIFSGLLLCLTIVGIPFARQHMKLIPLALFPFNMDLRRT